MPLLQDRAAGKKSKPMTATATTMVKAIWQSYFNVSGQKEGEEGTAPAEVAPAAKVGAECWTPLCMWYLKQKE